MKNYQKEIIKLTAKEILLTLFDITTPFFEASSIYRKSTKKYLEERVVDRGQFFEKLKYLKRHGYIETFIEGKEKFVELNPKGLTRIQQLQKFNFKIKRNKKWDGKWRVVIFDIPQDKKDRRDMLRRRLVSMEFYQIQKSIYVFPFECTSEVETVSKELFIERYVLIMISDIIQGEEQMVEWFLDQGILKQSDLDTR